VKRECGWRKLGWLHDLEPGVAPPDREHAS
jgi:hypothetical protein